MGQLNIEANLRDFDGFYELLIDTHRDLSTAQSHELNAKLVLLLSNHIGDIDILRDALERARNSVSELHSDVAPLNDPHHD